ncbi:hypothetical protein DB31_7786 [Hyalangium minutum]|uniref:Uncharacterized protein n=1 Tax=Hyalangium minutum TaxID=394096 RepID=A0A085WLI6_9BACT|nr:hypothetical protein DB31_7786 [Hyalangium minutum]
MHAFEPRQRVRLSLLPDGIQRPGPNNSGTWRRTQGFCEGTHTCLGDAKWATEARVDRANKRTLDDQAPKSKGRKSDAFCRHF